MTTTSRNMRLERMGADLETFEEDAKVIAHASKSYDRNYRGGVGRGIIDEELIEVLTVLFQKAKRGEVIAEHQIDHMVRAI